MVLRRRLHLQRAFHIHSRHAGRRAERRRAGHQRHFGAQFRQGGGDGVTLLAAGAIGQAAHRVDRLECRPGGDDRLPARQRPPGGARRQADDGVENGRRLGHPARPEFATGHLAVVRPHDRDAVETVESLQPLDIGLDRRMQPHPYIHGRGQQHPLVRGDQGGGGQIVGQTVRRLGDQARRRRGHDHQIGPARQLDMAHGGFFFGVEKTRPHRMARQRRQRQGGDELGPGFGQDHPRLAARLGDQPHQLQRLVGGYAAADDQQDLAMGKGAAVHGSGLAILHDRVETERRNIARTAKLCFLRVKRVYEGARR